MTFEYTDKKLTTVFYKTEAGKKIYLLCETNANTKAIKFVQKAVDEHVDYPLNSIYEYTHGYVFVKVLLKPDGFLSDIEIVKGLDVDCDKEILTFFNLITNEKVFKPGKVDNKKVSQEMVIPVLFTLHGFNYTRNNSPYYYHHHNFYYFNHQHQIMMQQHMNSIRPPAGF